MLNKTLMITRNRPCKPPKELFWKKTIKGNLRECWRWVGLFTHNGYGVFKIAKKNIRAHRFSYEIHKGPIPKGLFVLHKCDNRACVNPEHLFLGTAKENTQDMLKKGRGSKPPIIRGSKNNKAVLTEKKVRQIKRLFLSGHKNMEISKLFGVSRDCIYDIRTGKSWRHIVIQKADQPLPLPNPAGDQKSLA